LASALVLAGCNGIIGDSPDTTTGTDPNVPTDKLPAGALGPINPGRVVAHRLNKVEYDNTVRDLIGIDLKPSSQFGFPDDNYVEGFDNNADSLSSSPLLLEKYQAATDGIVGKALDLSPQNAAVRARILSCDPMKLGEAACAGQVVEAFATRAFRRPVSTDEVSSYVTLLATAKSVGDGFEEGVRAALSAVLLSPKFLFRVEKNPGLGNVAPLSDYEIASRLSYFIWSSMPDEELFARAAAKTLHQPDEISLQVERMVKDPKATSFVDNLAGQWLGTRELVVKEITAPDANFDDALRSAMGQEAALFLKEMLSGTQPIQALLGTDFAFVNQRLAQHYGFVGATAYGTDFRKVMLTDDKRAGGILTQANFLTVQSQRDRTSPTKRGKWISENLLCVIVPPPPPKIPQLDPNQSTAPTSARERLALHRQKGSTCNGCHQYIDPLGLALEHYDVVGRWRDTDLGAAIDATGEIPTTGVPFDGAISLANALKNDDRFAACIVRKFLTYALGRSLNLNPQPGDQLDDVAGVGDLTARLASGGSNLSLLVDLIAKSPMMTMRLGEE
jgi:hypothetical protein